MSGGPERWILCGGASHPEAPDASPTTWKGAAAPVLHWGGLAAVIVALHPSILMVVVAACVVLSSAWGRFQMRAIQSAKPAIAASFLDVRQLLEARRKSKGRKP